MTRKEYRRIWWRTLKLLAKERAYDIAAVAWPIFSVTGLLVACIKFWWWLL